jgi:hypothetical protein
MLACDHDSALPRDVALILDSCAHAGIARWCKRPLTQVMADRGKAAPEAHLNSASAVVQEMRA